MTEFFIKRGYDTGFGSHSLFCYVLSDDGVWICEYGAKSEKHTCHTLNDGRLSNNCRGTVTTGNCNS